MTSEPGADGQPAGPQPQAVPWRARISSVTGRRARGGQRGLSAIDRLSLQAPDGSALELGLPGRGEIDTLQFLVEIGRGVFQRDGTPCCPICIDGDPTDREHVPQQNLGGQVMTMTCMACNNGLGSRVEAALQDWFDHAYRRVAFEREDVVPGRRRAPTVYLREASDGSPVLLLDGALSPDVRRMFNSGQFNMQYTVQTAQRWRLALLKHAYLAACLHRKDVPDTELARKIRTDLLVARDGTNHNQLQSSGAAEGLKVYRSPVGRQGPPLALVAQHDANGETEPEVLISLAGALFVSWPFTDLPPVTWQRLESARE